MKIFWVGDEPVTLKEIFNPIALFRGMELRETAEKAFGDKAKAMQWTIRPNGALNGNKPLEVAVASDEGLKDALIVLGRIEHGIFS